MLAAGDPTPYVWLLAGVIVWLILNGRFRLRRRQEFRQRVLEMLGIATLRKLPIPPLLQRALREQRGRDRVALQTVYKGVESGEGLADSLAMTGRGYFPNHIVEAIRSAEACGRPAPVLASLARNETSSLSIRHRAQMTLAYPALLAVLLLLIGGLATHGGIRELTYVCNDIWSEPLGWKEYGYAWAGPIAAGFILVVILLLTLLRPLGKLPGALLGGGARFLRCAAPLASAGLPLHEVLQRSAPASGHRKLERAVTNAAQQLQAGEAADAAWEALPLPAFVRDRAGHGSQLSPARYGVLLEELGLECDRRQVACAERWLRWAGPALILVLAIAVFVQYGALFEFLEGVRGTIWVPW